MIFYRSKNIWWAFASGYFLALSLFSVVSGDWWLGIVSGGITILTAYKALQP